MTDKIKPLPDTIDELKALVLQLENKYNRLLEQFRLAQHQRFGKSSESDSTQFDLFNETEEESSLKMMTHKRLPTLVKSQNANAYLKTYRVLLLSTT
ncbi:transposase [Aliivibrio salmonicida]|uniref:transposase n=1 Tax=Aliivibrio salmonicida TaxID=40269 RepID=UPI001F5CED1E|nr:transposase [Aliivibrio salmonicida]